MAVENKPGKGKSLPKDSEHLLYLNLGEETIYRTDGVLDNSVKGTLVLTTEKLFFYFESNISREQKFIGRHPYIVSAELKEGFLSSELVIINKDKTFSISKR